MAFTRKFLTALGIESEKIDEIISAHSEVVDGLKSERDSFKANAEKYDAMVQENEKLKKQIESKGADDFEQKYNDAVKEFDDYKKSIEAEKSENEKKSAYSKLLKESGISEKRIETILKVTNLSDKKLKDGAFEDADAIKESIKNEWKDFIEKPFVQGQNPANPPANNTNGTGMTKQQILAIKDGTERRKAIAENPDLFGLKTE